MNRLKTFIAAVAVAVFGALSFVSVPVAALDPLDGACSGNSRSEICKNRGTESATDLIGDIVNVLLFVIGAISVLMIIVGGILYATSTGDSGRVSKAKNTIMYAIVGLVVAFLAYAIVNWVLDIF